MSQCVSGGVSSMPCIGSGGFRESTRKHGLGDRSEGKRPLVIRALTGKPKLKDLTVYLLYYNVYRETHSEVSAWYHKTLNTYSNLHNHQVRKNNDTS